jgi:hypothetical protein
MKYVKIKDKSNSNGAYIAGCSFNNATVVAFEDNKVPQAIKVAMRNGILAEASKQEFEAWKEMQAEGAKNAEAKKLANAIAKEKRLESKTGVVAEKKEVAAKKEAPKAKEEAVEPKEDSKEEAKEDPKEKAAPKGKGKN